MAKVIFKYGTLDEYQAASPYSEDTLYFVTDKQKLYKGDKLIASTDVQFLDEAPQAENIEEGTLYVVTVDGKTTLYIKKDGEAVPAGGGGEVTEGAITSVTAFADDVLAKSTDEKGLTESDDKIPTEGAVKKAIDGAVKTVQDKLDTLEPEVKASLNGVSVGPADQDDKFRLTFTKTSGTDPITIDLDKEKYIYDAKVVENELVITVLISDGQGGTTTKDIKIQLSELLKVDATTVKTTEKITVTTDVGNYKKGASVDISDIQTILKNMLSQEFNPKRKSTPTVTLNTPANKAYEVGTTVTPSFTCSLSKGSYEANGTEQDAGVTAKSWVVTCNGVQQTTETSGSFEQITVKDGSNSQVIKAVATGSEGAIPKTNFGNNYDEDGELNIRFKDNAEYSKSSVDITGYRCWFTYVGTDTSSIDSEWVRTTATSKGSSSDAKDMNNVTIPVGTKRVMVAIPEGGKSLTEVIDVDGMGLSVMSNFSKTTVSVEGANGYEGKEYNVWTAENSNGYAASHYNFTIK